MDTTIPWYADCVRCRPFLENTGLSESDYLAAIGEVRALMPLEKAKRESVRIFSVGGQPDPPGLHPLPGCQLTHHPLPMLLTLDVPAVNVWVELTRLGLDLVATRSLVGIKSKKNALVGDFKQYLSTMFEIEVFAELSRAGMSPTIQKDTPDCIAWTDGRPINVEIKLGEAPFGASVFSAIGPPFVDDFGTFRIQLCSGVGGRGELVKDIAGVINADMQQLLEEPSLSPLSRPSYRIEYDSATEAREVVFSFGGAPTTYAQMLENHVVSRLQEKDEKLAARDNDATPSLVALDLRSLVRALPRPGGGYTGSVLRTKEHQEALVRGMHRFLSGAKAVTAVLAWWRKFEWWDMNLREECFRPWDVTLTTVTAHETVEEPQMLAPLSKSHLMR